MTNNTRRITTEQLDNIMKLTPWSALASRINDFFAAPHEPQPITDKRLREVVSQIQGLVFSNYTAHVSDDLYKRETISILRNLLREAGAL